MCVYKQMVDGWKEEREEATRDGRKKEREKKKNFECYLFTLQMHYCFFALSFCNRLSRKYSESKRYFIYCPSKGGRMPLRARSQNVDTEFQKGS